MCCQMYQLEDEIQTMKSSWNTKFHLSNNFATAVDIIGVAQYSDTHRLKMALFSVQLLQALKVKIAKTFQKGTGDPMSKSKQITNHIWAVSIAQRRLSRYCCHEDKFHQYLVSVMQHMVA